VAIWRRLGRTYGAHLPAEGELPEGQERLAWATPPIKELAIRPGGRRSRNHQNHLISFEIEWFFFLYIPAVTENL
jgi:hypothetical protein